MNTLLKNYTNLLEQIENHREQSKEFEKEFNSNMCKLIEEICEYYKNQHIILTKSSDHVGKEILIGKIYNIKTVNGHNDRHELYIELSSGTLNIIIMTKRFTTIQIANSKPYKIMNSGKFLESVKIISKEQFDFLSMNFTSIVDVVENKILYI